MATLASFDVLDAGRTQYKGRLCMQQHETTTQFIDSAGSWLIVVRG
jgi:hypothetical protein